jgi:radical SAM superfamily enzyme YgiQ (UPF0313 family)
MAIDPWKGGAGGSGRYAPFNYSVRKIQAAVVADPALADVEVRLIDTDSKDVDALVDQIEAFDPDIIGASAYVWSFSTFLKVCERIKTNRPDRTVIFGGPSARVEMFQLPPYVGTGQWVDALVLGEGEEIFREIVGMPDRSRDALRDVPGLAILTADGWIKTREAKLPVLDSLASPFQIGLVDSVVTAHLETFRGCPLSCTFCQWGDLSDARRVFSTEYLIRELEAFRAVGAAGVELVDAALNLNAKAFRNLVAAEKAVGFLKQTVFKSEIYPAHLTDDHLAFLEEIRPDCLGIGLQSYDEEVLRRMERPFNAARFEKVVHDVAGIAPNSVIEIIMGLPGDNPDSFRRTVERARKLPLPLRLYKCMVLPNALMTRSPAHYALEYDYETLHLISCWGWSAEDVRAMCDELTAMCEAEGGEMGPNYWTVPAAERAVRPAEAALRASLEMVVGSASGGAWRLLAATQVDGHLDLRVETPVGPVGVRIAPAVGGERYYRVIGGVGYSYLTMPDLQAPDPEVFERFIHGAHPALHGAVQSGTAAK